jgi:hypothetical protein
VSINNMKTWFASTVIALVFAASTSAQERCNAPDTHLYDMQTDETGRFLVSTTTGIFVTPCLNDHTQWEKRLPPEGDFDALPLAKGGRLVATFIGSAGQEWCETLDMGRGWDIQTYGDSTVNIEKIYIDERKIAHGYSTQPSSTVPVSFYQKYDRWDRDTVGFHPGVQSYGTAMASDGHGALYFSGQFPGYVPVMRRPIGGGKWITDTVGLGPAPDNFTQLAATRDGKLIGTTATDIYLRADKWWLLSRPPSALSNPGKISIDSNNVLFCVYSGQYLNGLYYTKDFGITWAFTGLEGKTVWSLMSFGDTTFIATDDGIYKVTIPTSVVVSSAIIPSAITNYPNPFYAATTFRFTLPTREHVILTIRDILGHEVARLVDGVMDAGEQQLTWSVGGLPEGVYVVEVRTDAGVARRPVTLMR